MKLLKRLLILSKQQLFPELKNCHQGNAIEKVKAYEENQKNRENLVIPFLNWVILGLMFLSLSILLEKYQHISMIYQLSYILVGILFTGCFLVSMLFFITYLYLTHVDIVYPDKNSV